MPRKVKTIESGMFFRKLPFVRLVKQIIQDMPEPDVHVSSKAMEGVQDITETYMEGMMEDAKLAIEHANRETLRKEDIDLVRKIARRCHPSEDDQSPRPSRVRPRKDDEDDVAVTKKDRKKQQKRKTERRILEDNEAAISMPGIQRAAVKAQIDRVGEDVYDHCTEVVKGFLEQFLKDAIISAKYNRRYTIKEADVLDAAKRNPSL
jgi:histone H3/H4